MSAIGRWVSPKTWWAALDMDLPSLLEMMKGALPPVIVIAMHQSTAVADVTVTVGYLAALISVSAQCLLPRAKFVKIMALSILTTCSAAALCCLACYTSVRARQSSSSSSTASSDGSVPYNSSACTVAAIWLILSIWAANSLRAWRPPELQDPMVAFCIFVVVTLTRAGTFADVQEGLDFIERLLKTFLIGLAVASGVSILVLPSTCRGAVFKDVKIYARDAKTILDSLVDFVQNAPGDTFLVASADSQSNEAAEASRQILSATISKLNALDSRVQSSLKYAKDEIAWGKLDASDLEEMSSLLRNLLRPLSGLGLVPRTRDNFAHIQPLPRHAIVESDKSGRIIEGLRSYSSKARGLISLILSYFLVQLEVGDKDDGTSKEVDFGEPVKLNPADPESIHLLEKFSVTLKSAGRRLTDEILTSSEGGISTDEAGLQDRVKQALQQEYFLALHVISLLDMAVEESLALAYFAQSKVTDSTMLRRRLIYSDLGFRRVLDSCKKLVTRSSHRDKSRKAREEHDAPKVVDPEHLEPANLWERGSGRVGNILGLIGSDLSMFGMRASAASFCIGLLAFLHQTQEFFIHQRGVWAMIVIVIGMSPTSGQSFFGFIARILASVCSVVLSLAAWYIVDGKTPGVIITLFLANIIEFYVYVKHPRFFGPSVIAIVTLNVIIGYELQVYKLGKETAESNGQPYYPIYIFGPYKLLAVIAGCTVSFFWVLFPYPISAKSKVPRLVGQSLFGLAKIYSTMHSIVEMWISSLHTVTEGPLPAHTELTSTMGQEYKRELFLLESLKSHSHFAKFEPPTGGKFPVAIYNELAVTTHNCLSILALMGHTGSRLLSASEVVSKASEKEDDWVPQLRIAAAESAEFRSHSLTSLFCHLSSAMTHQQSLPPFLSVPAPFPLFRELQRLEYNTSSIEPSQFHVFRAFISLEVLRTMLHFELESLLERTRMLVGEIRFDSV